jgi:hypothetical protein
MLPALATLLLHGNHIESFAEVSLFISTLRSQILWWVGVCVCVCVCVCVYVCVYVCVCMCVQGGQVKHTATTESANTAWQRTREEERSAHACMHAYIHTYIYPHCNSARTCSYIQTDRHNVADLRLSASCTRRCLLTQCCCASMRVCEHVCI